MQRASRFVRPTNRSVAHLQARITLPAGWREPVEEVRLRWNPEKATGNPAHLTVIYQDELASGELIRDRLMEAAGSVQPFQLHVGVAARFNAPDCGAYLSVTDPGASVAAFRNKALRQPSRPRARFGLHVTVLHPSQGGRLEEAWADISGIPELGAFQVDAIEIVDEANRVVESVKLSGRARTA